jgi:hypothetical protein
MPLAVRPRLDLGVLVGLVGRPECEVGYEHGVICASGERVLVVGAEGPERELGVAHIESNRRRPASPPPWVV